MTARLNMRILLIVLIVALVMIVPVYATVYGQEATATVAPAEPTTAAVEEALPESSPVAGVAEETDGQANGVTTLVLLVGLGAVGLVGFGTLLRQNYQAPQE